MTDLVIRKAERRKAKLRCALIGVSGSGKTYSSLLIAKGLGGKVCVIDTENRSADLYANSFDYDVAELSPPYEPQKYIDAINKIGGMGYETIIIDSLSHAWSGEGGALDMKDKLEKTTYGMNSFTAWRAITPMHNNLINSLLQSPCNIITTMRSKTHYDMQENDKGKKVPVKIGMAPVQRDGMEYEFTIVMDVAQNHYCTASKDRTGLFNSDSPFIATTETGEKISEWLNEGKDEREEVLNKISDMIEHFKGKFIECLTIDELKIKYSEMKDFFSMYSSVYSEARVAVEDFKKMAGDLKTKLTEKKDD